VTASWKDLVRAPLRPAPAYHVPSYPNAIKLDANESPFQLSKKALDAVAGTLTRDLNRYPDAACNELRAVMAKRLGVEGNQLCFGNGSDELISLLCGAFAEPRKKNKPATVLYPVPSFVVYKTAALAHGMGVVEVPFGPRMEADDAALLAAVEREKPNIVFLATPNNPTGTVWSRATIAKLLVQHPDVITVVDEAYLAYAEARTCVDLALAHPHCLVMQTLSKIGLAGLRLGYLIGRAEVIAEVEKVRPPYNLSTLAQRAATVLLRDHSAELESHFDEVKSERARLGAELAKLPGVEVFPSDANLFLVRVPGATKVFTSLAERGVVVRNFDRPGTLLEGCLRITVGTRVEDDWLLDALRSVLASDKAG
jgi:histidinol-phosphate aminotransferase